MAIPSSGTYATVWQWLREAVRGRDVILRSASALEYLGFFSGYVNESAIDVYAETEWKQGGVNCIVVESLDSVEHFADDGVLCCTFDRAVNDMLRDYSMPGENMDSEALAQALSRYYHANGSSFAGIAVLPENERVFRFFSDWAAGYYDET